MMRARTALLALVCAGAMAAQEQPSQQRENPFTPFDRVAFQAAMTTAGASEAQLAQFGSLCAESSEAAAAEWILRTVFPAYDAAVKQVEAGDPRGAVTLGTLLGEVKEPHVVAHTRYHLGRLFLDVDDPESATEVFGDYLKQSRNRTPLDGEVVFFYGTALAGIPEREAAARVLSEFLLLFKDAPERYRASAEQLVAEFGGKTNPLHDIADVMKGVERRIKKTNTGEDTQQRQEDVIAQLQKIIEQIEEQEKQSGGGGGGSPTSPRAQSNLTPGESRIGNLGRPSGVTDRWGTLKDRDRKTIESEAEARLSGRNKKLVDDYYRRLSRGRGQ